MEETMKKLICILFVTFSLVAVAAIDICVTNQHTQPIDIRFAHNNWTPRIFNNLTVKPGKKKCYTIPQQYEADFNAGYISLDYTDTANKSRFVALGVNAPKHFVYQANLIGKMKPA